MGPRDELAGAREIEQRRQGGRADAAPTMLGRDDEVDLAAKPGQAATIVRVWGGDSMLAFYRNPQATPRRGVTFGYTAQFGTRVSGQIAEPKMGLRGSVRFRVGESVNEMIVCNDLAFLFQDCLA